MEERLRLAYERYYMDMNRKAEALFAALRELIVDGVLVDGERLPSTRKLAELYTMSRGSVNQAYDMLYAEGFVRSDAGSGTFVAYRQPDFAFMGQPAGAQLTLSVWAERLSAVPERIADADRQVRGIEFTIGQTDKLTFPLDEWKTVMFEQVRDMMERNREDSFKSEGHQPLREAIMHELRRDRGIIADSEDIVITSGSMYALGLLTMLLINPGDAVVLENPSYDGIQRAVQAAGGLVVKGEVDDNGIVPRDWQSKLLFVTPSRQFPTGVQLSGDRKTQLLEWASRRGAVIVEDDYDSEFRHGGRPSEPLKALDREGRVVYIGSFSKTMYTDIRLGYAIVPQSLREPLRRAKYMLEPHPSSIAEQRALAAFMASGQYSRHLRRQRRIYGRRLLHFREEAERLMNGLFRFIPSDAGLQQYAIWQGEAADYERLRQASRSKGVIWSSGDSYWLEKSANTNKVQSALFGFAHLSEAEITEGLQRIGECWQMLKRLDTDMPTLS